MSERPCGEPFTGSGHLDYTSMGSGQSTPEMLERPCADEVSSLVQAAKDHAATMRRLAKVEAERDAARAEVATIREETLRQAQIDVLSTGVSRAAVLVTLPECHKRQCPCCKPTADEFVGMVLQQAAESVRWGAYERSTGQVDPEGGT